MPLYEYRCPSCGESLEILQRLGETSAGTPCPRCGRPDPEKVHSSFAAAGPSASPASGGCRPGGRFT